MEKAGWVYSNSYEANTTIDPQKDFIWQPAISTSNNNFIIISYNNISFKITIITLFRCLGYFPFTP